MGLQSSLGRSGSLRWQKQVDQVYAARMQQPRNKLFFDANADIKTRAHRESCVPWVANQRKAGRAVEMHNLLAEGARSPDQRLLNFAACRMRSQCQGKCSRRDVNPLQDKGLSP